ncbi:MAG: hypothetical protein HYZ75_05585 [Elusimicrobia bacterium]|nr:hypothetical protein [Elusimicrobiota bacterium]
MSRAVFIALAAVLSALVPFLMAQDAPLPSASTPEASVGVEKPAPRLAPPAAPAHARRNLDSPTELARDLAEVVAYLDAGQAFFRAYQKGSHTVEENRQFLAFLETYEKEYAVARKEVDALRKWIIERGTLDEAAKP